MSFSSVLFFSRSVMSNSLWPNGLQHARPPCPSPSPRVCSNSCLLSQWCYLTISSSAAPFSLCLQSLPLSGSFSNELTLCIRWPNYWSFSFSINPSSEHSRLISLRIDWFDLLAIQGPLENHLQHQFESINSSGLSLLYSPTLTSVYNYWKKQLWLYELLSAKWCLCFLICYLGFHSFPSEEQASFNIMAAVTIHSDFGAQEKKMSLLVLCHS